MQQLNVRIADEEAEALSRIASQSNGILTKQGVVRLLIRQAMTSNWDPLDNAATLGAPDGTKGATSTSSIPIEVIPTRSRNKKGDARGKRDPYTFKAISADLVPSDLLDCQQLLPEFWAVKKGTRSQGVWNRVCGKLRGWTPEQRREALERAIASGWGDVFEPQSQPAPRTAAGGGRKPLDQLASEMDAMPALW
jgi:hypothetical protein